MGSIDAYERGQILGKGSFGSAILATRKADGKKFVIKEIDMARMPVAERDASHQEAKLLKELNHPNIVRCTECFTSGNKLCIVMDWCSEGDIYVIMQKRKGQLLPEDTILDWFVQMCLGLKHVHDRKILHRDLKTQNVFMSTGGLLKLGDFGVSKILNSTWQMAATAVGTPYYLSPEICQNKRYNQKSDIWSLGCVLYEITNMRHAFEAPNMRALIQKIIKGQYTPLPTSRSRELRELVDRMLTLDQKRRPSINEILASPIMKTRIQKFLSATLQANEFSHTIIHGKPKPGALVVGAEAAPAGSRPAAAPAVASAVTKAPIPVRSNALPSQAPSRAPGVAPAAPVRASRVAPPPAPSPRPRAPPTAASPQPVRASAPAPTPSPKKPGLPGAGSPAVRASVARPPPSPILGVRPSPSPAPAARPSPSPVSAARASPSPVPAARLSPSPANRPAAGSSASSSSSVAAKPSTPSAAAVAGAAAAKQRAQVEAAAKARRDSDVQRGREKAAMQAQREIERMRLEEQCRKIEQDRAKMEKDRLNANAKRAEDDRKSAAQQDAANKKAVEDEKKKRVDDAKKKKVEEDQKKREADRKAKENEREEMRAKIAAQKKAYFDTQTLANKAKAEAEAAAGVHKVANRVSRSPPRPTPAPPARRPWSPVHVPGENREKQNEEEDDYGAAQPVEWKVIDSKDDQPTPEQRKAAWDDMKAQAERNKRQVDQDDGRKGGLAVFLGVPPSDTIGPRGGSADVRPSSEQRRQAYLEQKQEVERNRRQVVGDRPVTPPYAVDAGENLYERKQRKLDEERQLREQQLAESQKQHWKEMKDAADRNRNQIMSEMHRPPGTPGALSQPPPPPLVAPHIQQQPSGQEDNLDDTMDFAAMVKDMQHVLGDEDDGDDGDDDDIGDDRPEGLNGKFTLNGETIDLPVQESDSLALKVEALRMFLEEKLGTHPFLKVYRRLESLTMEDDESEVSKEFLAVLGQDKLPYLQLVHQLIITEERMNNGDAS